MIPDERACCAAPCAPSRPRCSDPIEARHAAHLRRRGRRAFGAQRRAALRARLPAHHQPRRPRPRSAARRGGELVGERQRLHATCSRPWAPRTSPSCCRRSPGCYVWIGNGDRASTAAVHAAQPAATTSTTTSCPLGAAYRVRLVEHILADA
ncbi:MAG: hypothetical protein MZW92_67950 [Comamonadaceae bacterium]|nr:hypothetical protein [Comamonadaceae bacterium]